MKRRGSHMLAIARARWGEGPPPEPAFSDRRTKRAYNNYRPHVTGAQRELDGLKGLVRWSLQRRRARQTHPGKRSNP